MGVSIDVAGEDPTPTDIQHCRALRNSCCRAHAGNESFIEDDCYVSYNLIGSTIDHVGVF